MGKEPTEYLHHDRKAAIASKECSLRHSATRIVARAAPCNSAQSELAAPLVLILMLKLRPAAGAERN